MHKGFFVFLCELCALCGEIYRCHYFYLGQFFLPPRLRPRQGKGHREHRGGTKFFLCSYVNYVLYVVKYIAVITFI